MGVQRKINGPTNLNLSTSKSENWWEEPIVQYGFISLLCFVEDRLKNQKIQLKFQL